MKARGTAVPTTGRRATGDGRRRRSRAVEDGAFSLRIRRWRPNIEPCVALAPSAPRQKKTWPRSLVPKLALALALGGTDEQYRARGCRHGSLHGSQRIATVPCRVETGREARARSEARGQENEPAHECGPKRPPKEAWCVTKVDELIESGLQWVKERQDSRPPDSKWPVSSSDGSPSWVLGEVLVPSPIPPIRGPPSTPLPAPLPHPTNPRSSRLSPAPLSHPTNPRVLPPDAKAKMTASLASLIPPVTPLSLGTLGEHARGSDSRLKRGLRGEPGEERLGEGEGGEDASQLLRRIES
ncbi:hypothetical protein BJ875DRAFT_438551 [Amylocarpus encephaloides]|uniref:Uncharacterized protein n=1 Tax=Amylocarpus encephaloides TaxID=45428 RepID=A0A9P7YNZ8_9HELO|nr:hypothetical protein BJ875DRAFT_438551 [Amylocarpus encephaloides]